MIYLIETIREVSSARPLRTASGDQTGQHDRFIHHVVQLIVLALQPQIQDLLILADERVPRRR